VWLRARMPGQVFARHGLTAPAGRKIRGRPAGPSVDDRGLVPILRASRSQSGGEVACVYSLRKPRGARSANPATFRQTIDRAGVPAVVIRASSQRAATHSHVPQSLDAAPRSPPTEARARGLFRIGRPRPAFVERCLAPRQIDSIPKRGPRERQAFVCSRPGAPCCHSCPGATKADGPDHLVPS